MSARGSSDAVAFILFLLTLIIPFLIVAVMYRYSYPSSLTVSALYPPPLTVSAEMTHSALIDNGTQQLLAFSFNVTSHMKEPAELAEVVANVTTLSGARAFITLSPGSPNASAASVTASLAYSGDGPLPLPAGQSRTLHVNLTAPVDNPIVSVQFELVFVTSSGNVMTFLTSTYSMNTVYPTS